MSKIKLLIVASILSFFQSMAGQVFLSEKPILIGIPLDGEVIVKFPDSVTHTEILNDGDTSLFRQFLTPEGVLYLSTDKTFSDVRMVANLVSGKTVVMNIKSGVGPHGRNIEILNRKVVKKSSQPVKQKAKPERNPNKPAFLRDKVAKTKRVNAKNTESNMAIGYAEMTRYAFRHFVGPSRLIGRKMGSTVKLSNKHLKRFVRVWKNKISLRPLKQWKINNKFVTVLLINNTSERPIHFDPRALRGRIEFAAALHPTLSPQGTSRDRTLWAVITSIPFNQAIRI